MNQVSSSSFDWQTKKCPMHGIIIIVQKSLDGQDATFEQLQQCI